MGRSPLLITEKELVQVLKDLEFKNTYSNLSQLYEAVCETPWAKNMTNAAGTSKPLKPINVYQYVQNFKIADQLKTKPGKRGNANLANIARTGKTGKGRVKKMEGKPGFLLAEARLKYNFKKRPKLLANVLKGSMSAAIKAKCLDCAGSAAEACKCTCYGCPLYLISPFTGKNNLSNTGYVEKEDDDDVQTNV